MTPFKNYQPGGVIPATLAAFCPPMSSIMSGLCLRWRPHRLHRLLRWQASSVTSLRSQQ